MSLPNKMPSLQDKEINQTSEDSFGHRHFVEALKSLIESDTNQPPYSIGLLGKWGTGKSSVKSMYISQLKDDRSDSRRHEKIHTITFNAWRYGGEDLKRTLLKHVFLELGGDSSKLDDALYCKIQKTVQEAKGWREIFKDIYEKWPWMLPQLLTALILIGITWLVLSYFRLDNDWANTLLLGILATCITYIFDPKRFLIPRYSNFLRINEPSTKSEQYEEMLLDQLNFFKNGSSKTNPNGKKCERLVIFIDDLDRLPADEMVEGLDAIRTFMEIPNYRLPKDLGIVFVISCDEERVADTLRKNSINNQLPSSIINRDDARRFLDRIFQFRLEIPPFPKRDMLSYAIHKMETQASEISKDLKEKGHDVESVIARMIHPGVQNPRNALQILNQFIQSWWLASKRESEGSGTDLFGGLAEGVVTKHPKTLAALSALKVDFADFYNDLEHETNLIKYFCDFFIHKTFKIEKLPSNIKPLLLKYCNIDKITDTVKEVFIIKPEYDELYHFIYSLRNMEFPDSLDAFIQLSQDPLVRRFGDERAGRIKNALMISNTEAVIKEFDHQDDIYEFSKEQLELLQDIVFDIHHEPNDRIENTYISLVELETRIISRAKIFLAQVSRSIVKSNNFRTKIGLEGIEKCIKYAPDTEKRNIANKLIEDFLRTDDSPIDFKLKNGDILSLEEATNYTYLACDLILRTQNKYGLFEADQRQLIIWLQSPNIRVPGGNLTIPFSKIEQWMDTYEHTLLKLLYLQYCDLVIRQLDNDDIHERSIEKSLSRCGIIFNKAYSGGEESRNTMYSQLARLANTKSELARVFSFEQMKDKHDHLSKQAIETFINSSAQRIITELEDAEHIINSKYETIYNSFIDFIRLKHKDLKIRNIYEPLNMIIIKWLSGEEKDFSIELLDVLNLLDNEYCNKTISEILTNNFYALHENYVAWLMKNYILTMNNENKEIFMSKISDILNRTSIEDAKEIKIINTFLNNIDPAYKEEALFRNLISQLLRNLQNRASNTANTN